MAIRNKEISKELGDQLRAVSFSSPKEPANDSEVHIEEAILTSEEEVVPEVQTVTSPKNFSINKRVVTLEYLDKFEQATAASAKYESLKEFSHIISNISIFLLVLSIIIYSIVYFINPQAISFVSLLTLSLEALGLLGLTLYSMTKASTHRQIRDILASDFSTCSQAIGIPRSEASIPHEIPEIVN